MNEMVVTGFLIVTLFALLGSGVWIGLTLAGVAWIGMELFSSRSAGDAMAVTIWGSASSWTLTALPLFIWMGEILFRTKLSENMFKGLAPWLERLPGRLLHTNIIGSTIFAAVSGSSAATCATIGKMTLPELAKRGYPEHITIATLAGASTLGLLIPPSIIMIVYGVAANVSIAQLFIAGVLPGILLAGLFMGYTIVWALLHPGQIPPAGPAMSFVEKLQASRNLLPVVALIGAVLGSVYSGIATATESAALGVVGALVIATLQGGMGWYMVMSGLTERTSVSQYRLAAHLGLAILIFGVQDAVSKYLVQDYSPFQLAMMRFWAFAAFSLVLPVLRRTAVPTVAAGVSVDTHHACGFHRKLLQDVQVISVRSLLR